MELESVATWMLEGIIQIASTPQSSVGIFRFHQSALPVGLPRCCARLGMQQFVSLRRIKLRNKFGSQSHCSRTIFACTRRLCKKERLTFQEVERRVGAGVERSTVPETVGERCNAKFPCGNLHLDRASCMQVARSGRCRHSLPVAQKADAS